MTEQLIFWIKSGLKRTGKTQSALAEHLGLAHPQITQILKGSRAVKVNELPKIAEFIETASPLHFDEVPIQSDKEILQTLHRIEGLDQRGVEVVFSVIDTVINRQPSKPARSSSDDQLELATLHREPKP
ncbi:helix-turn-helix domain-containing protein [Bacillus subtilis]|uniref:helix-turn-helix domain-containing protein n=1 Tax=Pseudochrobactrum asaccharolyticum TaxID=354351 RepID=UPI001F37A48F|nr:helix-turn-helix transcriptional regulator [Pseudochrobactrum asaccharolyticum]MCF7647286.1 helix-turn-helix domain-containing protein [Pseudochrobactrum asaccharolyticum]MCF7673577.1 helix-turn-helix domain-containing protein [Bacillus subtilis]